MAWAKLDSTTLVSSSVTVSSAIPVPVTKKFIQVLCHALEVSSPSDQTFRFGTTIADTGANNASRFSGNGGADGTDINNTRLYLSTASIINDNFEILYMMNISTREKLVIFFGVNPTGTGAGNAPNRHEGVGKWVNTSTQSDVFQMRTDNGIKTFASNSNITVIGTD